MISLFNKIPKIIKQFLKILILKAYLNIFVPFIWKFWWLYLSWSITSDIFWNDNLARDKFFTLSKNLFIFIFFIIIYLFLFLIYNFILFFYNFLLKILAQYFFFFFYLYLFFLLSGLWLLFLLNFDIRYYNIKWLICFNRNLRKL